MKKLKTLRVAALALALTAPLTPALATNGYFSHGYGMKAKGMGGAAVASDESAFAGANNPATAAFAGNRTELGVDVFMPSPRGMERTGNAAMNAAVNSDGNVFYVPEFALNRVVNDKVSAGVSVYGNGGLNTDYAGGQINCTALGASANANVLCGQGRLGIDMLQLVVAPTIGYKLGERSSIGVSPLLVYQQFKADGLQMFKGISNDQNNLTGNGYDISSGVGVRLGYFVKLSHAFNFGVSYSPRIAMSRLSRYAGLFADGGNFNIPENYALGVAFLAAPTVQVALDYERINYSAVPSVGNPMTNAGNLGLNNGKGFGWSDVDVWKLGAQWQATPNLALRAGINVGSNPIQARDVTFNILAPGVVTTHYTLGGTYAVSKNTELTLAYMYAPSNSVTGSSFFGNWGQASTETIRMSQQSLGVQFGWKF